METKPQWKREWEVKCRFSWILNSYWSSIAVVIHMSTCWLVIVGFSAWLSKWPPIVITAHQIQSCLNTDPQGHSAVSIFRWTMFKQTTVCLRVCLFEELCYLGVCIGCEYCTEIFDSKYLHSLMSLGLACLLTADWLFLCTIMWARMSMTSIYSPVLFFFYIKLYWVWVIFKVYSETLIWHFMDGASSVRKFSPKRTLQQLCAFQFLSSMSSYLVS